MIKCSFVQQIALKSYQVILANRIAEVKFMFKTWNIGLICNKIILFQAYISYVSSAFIRQLIIFPLLLSIFLQCCSALC